MKCSVFFGCSHNNARLTDRRIRALVRVVAAIQVLVHPMMVTSLWSQDIGEAGILSGVADSNLIAAAAAKADTGRWTPGHKDFSRYNTPGMCLSAMITIESAIWRRGQRDTIQVNSAGDTLVTAAFEAGRLCVGQLEIEKLQSMDFEDMMKGLVMLNDTVRLSRLIQRQHEVAATDVERAFFLYDILLASTSERPMRVHIAKAVMRRMPTVGPNAGEVWAQAYVHYRRNVLWELHDTTEMWHDGWAARQRLEHVHDVNGRSGIGLTLLIDSIRGEFFRRPADLPQKVIARLEEFDRHPHTIPENVMMFVKAGLLSQALSVDRVSDPLTGGIWFPDTAARVYATPRPGKVTLWWHAQRGAYRDGTTSRTIAMLRRLHQRYASAGLDIVISATNYGFLWRSPPLSFEKEAESVAWYFRDFMGLPFPVHVGQRSVDLSVREGSARYGDNKGWPKAPDGEGVLPYPAIFGRNQRIFTVLYGSSEQELVDYLEKALAEKP